MPLATNKTQFVDSGHWLCIQLNSRWDELSERGANSEYFPPKSLNLCYLLAQQVGTYRVQNCVPRPSSVHSKRPGYSSSIPLSVCRTLETKQRQRKAQEEEISLRSFLRNAILLTSHAMQIRSIWPANNKKISKTIACSDREWALDWFSCFFDQGWNKGSRGSKTIETGGNNEGRNKRKLDNTSEQIPRKIKAPRKKCQYDAIMSSKTKENNHNTKNFSFWQRQGVGAWLIFFCFAKGRNKWSRGLDNGKGWQYKRKLAAGIKRHTKKCRGQESKDKKAAKQNENNEYGAIMLSKTNENNEGYKGIPAQEKNNNASEVKMSMSVCLYVTQYGGPKFVRLSVTVDGGCGPGSRCLRLSVTETDQLSGVRNWLIEIGRGRAPSRYLCWLSTEL